MAVDRWREWTGPVPNSGKVPRERFCLLSSTMLCCPAFIPPSLCLTSLPRLPFVLFSANDICCYSQRLTSYKNGQCVYTSIHCGITSALRLSMCVVGRKERLFLWERKDQRDTGSLDGQTWFHSSFARQFNVYLVTDRNSHGILLVWLGKLTVQNPSAKNGASWNVTWGESSSQ